MEDHASKVESVLTMIRVLLILTVSVVSVKEVIVYVSYSLVN